MKNKKCIKCKLHKPLDQFYKHSEMKDGFLSKCKDCSKKDVRENYKKNREHYADYERKRSQNPERKKRLLEYQRKMRKDSPLKSKARYALSNAIRDGKIKKEPCAICGDENSEAHHVDYNKFLDVIWLCRKHHLIQHKKESYE